MNSIQQSKGETAVRFLKLTSKVVCVVMCMSLFSSCITLGILGTKKAIEQGAGRQYRDSGTVSTYVSTNVNLGGTWGVRWHETMAANIQFSNSSFVVTVFPRNDEPWNYVCKITLQGFRTPSKEELRQHEKSKTWFDYPCTVEYFYDVQYPTLEDCFANAGGFIVNSKNKDASKRIFDAKIRLNDTFFTDRTDGSQILSLEFEDLGYGINLATNIYYY